MTIYLPLFCQVLHAADSTNLPYGAMHTWIIDSSEGVYYCMSPEQSPERTWTCSASKYGHSQKMGRTYCFSCVYVLDLCSSTWIENATSRRSNLTIMIQVQSFQSRSTYGSPVHSFKGDFSNHHIFPPPSVNHSILFDRLFCEKPGKARCRRVSRYLKSEVR